MLESNVIEADLRKMTIGFLATAYMTLSIVCLYYFVNYVPKEFMNRIDQGILSFLWRKARSQPSHIWEPTLRRAVLTFSDQQIVTGLAILIGGYAQLPYGLSSYHWQIVVYLAWFSSVTHLTTLTFLRRYFRENPEARLWRTLLMFSMVSLLVIALIPTGDGGWYLANVNNKFRSGIPALCYFKRLSSQPPNRFTFDASQSLSMMLSQFLLFLSYVGRLVKVFSSLSVLTSLWIKEKPKSILTEALRKSMMQAGRPGASCLHRTTSLVYESVLVFAKACINVYESTLWEVRCYPRPCRSISA